MSALQLRQVAPDAEDVRPLVEAHLAHSKAATPQTSCHTMTAAEMQSETGLQFWALYQDNLALACGALKALGDNEVEVKSVHVAEAARGQGYARQMMAHLIEVAKGTGHRAMILETGSHNLPDYDAARALYERLGFSYCDVIQGYARDPNSAFMRLDFAV